jgi:GntR family transcriptional regulator
MTPANVRAKAEASESVTRLPAKLAGKGSKGQQLRALLERLVAELKPDTLLPSERLLAERFGVARMTVRGEIDRLVRLGSVYRRHGLGTFVAPAPVVLASEIRSFTEDMRARGLTPGSQVIAQEAAEFDPLLVAWLELPSDLEAIRIKRVRTADGEPLAVEEAYMPAERFPGLLDADLSEGSLYGLLAERWGVEVRLAEHRVLAVTLGPEDARLLDAQPDQAGLLVYTAARDAGHGLVSAGVSLYRGDRYEFLVHQQRL